MRPEHIDHVAAGLASLSPGDPERAAAEEHAASCARCAAALSEACALMALLDEAPVPSLAPAALERIGRRVRARVTAPARPSPLRALPLAVLLAASLLLALLTGSDGAFVLGHGLHCMALELGVAALPYAAAAALALRRRAAGDPWTFAAVAAAGALVGQARLLVSCPDRAHTPHLIATHVAGVVLAAALGALGQRAVARRVAGRP
jgi:hypothetical protein